MAMKAAKNVGADYDQAYASLVRAVLQEGYPEEFAQVLAGELRSPAAIGRMAAYIRNVHPTGPEQIADEMLAIVYERDRWVQQKMSEHANASITAFYNRPRDLEDA